MFLLIIDIVLLVITVVCAVCARIVSDDPTEPHIDRLRSRKVYFESCIVAFILIVMIILDILHVSLDLKNAMYLAWILRVFVLYKMVF